MFIEENINKHITISHSSRSLKFFCMSGGSVFSYFFSLSQQKKSFVFFFFIFVQVFSSNANISL
ncbi:hypothetical protein HANVADRAFT_116142 [Hanseniaspora valbyensis NRRL Y-1626]|uniref:Uncharacterized protein n=1 Tax=Hanseniaspora valbyensis NRRL Y-1626 TaxID=766949 RepID=A0A1B7TFH0_9ASCO|nr:hypothetical protein HANVADRAFT_116142 [Hanseniaspora valbyensis NRRL Y-1626]